MVDRPASPREAAVLGLIADGRSNAGIAGELVIIERAVEKHVHLLEARSAGEQV